MLDTMTITKAFASVCGALLVLLLGGWAADALYSVSRDSDQARGYVIIEEDDAASDEGAEEEEEEVVEVAFADVYAEADASAGEGLWRQCSACHVLEPGENRVGPYLHGVVDREQGAAEGFDYSDALASLDGAWTPENLSSFLENPREYAPGTAMAYNGMRDVEDRANLIAYLATFE